MYNFTNYIDQLGSNHCEKNEGVNELLVLIF